MLDPFVAGFDFSDPRTSPWKLEAQGYAGLFQKSQLSSRGGSYPRWLQSIGTGQILYARILIADRMVAVSKILGMTARPVIVQSFFVADRPGKPSCTGIAPNKSVCVLAASVETFGTKERLPFVNNAEQ